MKSLLITALIVYIAIGTLLYVYQRQLLYFPTPLKSVHGAQPIALSRPEGTLSGWVINPGQPQALLYYGGNAEPVEDNIANFAQSFPTLSIYLIPYRGYGPNPGAPSETALYQDALFVYDQVQSRHAQISVMGRSLGAGVATYVSARRPIRALVLVTPYDSIEQLAQAQYWLYPVHWLLWDKFKAWQDARHIQAPTLMVLAEQDVVIPHRHSENLASYLESVMLQKVEIPGSNHQNVTDFPAFRDIVSGFLSAQPHLGQ